MGGRAEAPRYTVSGVEKNSSVKVSVAAGGWGCMVWVRAGWHDVFPSVERRDEGGRFYHRAEKIPLVIRPPQSVSKVQNSLFIYKVVMLVVASQS